MSVRRRDGLDHLDAEPIALTERAQHTDVPRPLAAEAMIVANEELAHPITPPQNELHEILGRVGGQVGGKRHHRHVIDTCLGENLEFLVVGREQERRSGGIDDFQGVRIKGQENARNLERPRA
jgi:hypothetical protein